MALELGAFAQTIVKKQAFDQAKRELKIREDEQQRLRESQQSESQYRTQQLEFQKQKQDQDMAASIAEGKFNTEKFAYEQKNDVAKRDFDLKKLREEYHLKQKYGDNTSRGSSSLINYKDKRTENFLTTIEQNNVTRNQVKEAEQAAKNISSGLYGKVTRGFAKNLNPNNPALGDWQKIKFVLTDAQLLNVARTKGAISDREMELFAQAAANDDLTSIPRIMPVLKKVLNVVNANERGLANSFKKIYGEDPYSWVESQSNIGDYQESGHENKLLNVDNLFEGL